MQLAVFKRLTLAYSAIIGQLTVLKRLALGYLEIIRQLAFFKRLRLAYLAFIGQLTVFKRLRLAYLAFIGQLTVFKRLTLAYLAIMVPLIFLGIYVTLTLNHLNRLAHEITSIDSAAIRVTENLLELLLSQEGFERKYLISGDQDFHQRFQEIRGYFLNDLERLEPLANTSEKKGLFVQAKGMYLDYLSLVQKEFGFVANAHEYSVDEFKDKKGGILDDVIRKLGEIIQTARLDRDNKLLASSQISSRVLRTTGITAAIVVAMGILISFLNTKSINDPIRALQENTKKVSKGTFEEVASISSSSPPEIKELIEAFNLMCRRLKELEEMKADFMSHVSHDLRGPLTSINFASHALLKGVFSNAPKKQDKFLNIIEKESQRLMTSVDSLLDLSRMEANMMDYSFSQCQLIPLVQNTVQGFSPISLKKNITVELKLPPKLPAVRMDEDKIRHVMENLLGNALKFTSEGGNVVISAAPRENQKACVEVSVSDTGPGIAQADMKDIFDKFKRTRAGTQMTGGTGLGLSIAKYVVTAHGGKIWVESELEKGSTFFFTLPVV